MSSFELNDAMRIMGIGLDLISDGQRSSSTGSARRVRHEESADTERSGRSERSARRDSSYGEDFIFDERSLRGMGRDREDSTSRASRASQVRESGEPGRGEETYRIKRGDTLTRIAEEFDTTVTELARRNGIPEDEVDDIYTGDDLIVPSRTERAEGTRASAVRSADRAAAIARITDRMVDSPVSLDVLQRIQKNPDMRIEVVSDAEFRRIYDREGGPYVARSSVIVLPESMLDKPTEAAKMLTYGGVQMLQREHADIGRLDGALGRSVSTREEMRETPSLTQVRAQNRKQIADALTAVSADFDRPRRRATASPGDINLPAERRRGDINLPAERRSDRDRTERAEADPAPRRRQQPQSRGATGTWI